MSANTKDYEKNDARFCMGNNTQTADMTDVCPSVRPSLLRFREIKK